MSFNANDIATIEAYLKNDLASEERQLFDEQLATDTALQEEVEAHRKILNGFKMKRLERVRKKVSDLEAGLPAIEPLGKKEEGMIVSTEERKEVPMGKVRSLWRRMAVAASLVLLGGVIWWVITTEPQQNVYADMAKEFYELKEEPIGGKGDNEDLAMQVITQFENGHSAFSNGEFKKANRNFEFVLNTINANQGELFDTDNEEKIYLEHAEWAIAMSNLARNGNVDDVILSIQTIANNTEHLYSDNAKALLLKLRNQ